MPRVWFVVACALALAVTGCKKDEAAPKKASAPTASDKPVDWDEPNAKGETPAKPAATAELADEWPIEGPTGGSEFSRGGANKIDEIRQELNKYEGVFLKGWTDVLSADGAPAEEVQAALIELMNAVTGPAGLWTKLPNQWFGCADNQESPPCQAFDKVKPHFGKWAKFQAKLDSAAKSKRFLAKSHGKIMKYFKTYVPADRNLSAVQETAFFKEHIATSL